MNCIILMKQNDSILYTKEMNATLDTQQTSTSVYKKEETSIQRHARFWDKTNKGYITPLDTISGFITLGYGMVFSVAVGAFVGIFLSLSTQKGWFPDPLCRSNVRNLIRAKNQTQMNTGAYDEDGVFNSDKFDLLFAKYAKSDKSGNTISMIELVNMTKEQEKLGRNMKAWAASFIELCTAYFFIGHRGYLSKEDVRAAYDGSLFYRLTDDNRLRIENTKKSKSTINLLKGSYLSKPTAMLSPRALEHKLEVLLSSLQSKSSLAAEYGLNKWIAYVQDMTEKVKNRALKRPSHIVHGVSTPTKVSKHDKNDEVYSDPSNLFPNGLTGVAKEEDHNDAITEEYLSGLLSRSGSAELNEGGNKSEGYASMSSSGIFTVNASFVKHSPEAPIEEEEPFMKSVLRQDDNESTANILTGVQTDSKKSTHHGEEKVKDEENLATLSSSSSSNEEHENQNDKNEQIHAPIEGFEIKKDTSQKSVTNKELKVDVEESETDKEVPEPALTPPPEEKHHIEKQVKKTSPGKKNKKKNKQSNPELQQAAIH